MSYEQIMSDVTRQCSRRNMTLIPRAGQKKTTNFETKTM